MKMEKDSTIQARSSNTSSSSTMHVSLDYPASGDKQHRQGPELVLISGHVDDGIQISALDVSNEMDGRKSYIKEVLDWCREEDAGDLRRSELSEVVETMTCLNALEGKLSKSERSWKSEKVTRTSR